MCLSSFYQLSRFPSLYLVDPSNEDLKRMSYTVSLVRIVPVSDRPRKQFIVLVSKGDSTEDHLENVKQRRFSNSETVSASLTSRDSIVTFTLMEKDSRQTLYRLVIQVDELQRLQFSSPKKKPLYCFERDFSFVGEDREEGESLKAQLELWVNRRNRLVYRWDQSFSQSQKILHFTKEQQTGQSNQPKPSAEEDVSFYLGACESRNLFSSFDTRFSGQQYRMVEQEYGGQKYQK